MCILHYSDDAFIVKNIYIYMLKVFLLVFYCETYPKKRLIHYQKYRLILLHQPMLVSDA